MSRLAVCSLLVLVQCSHPVPAPEQPGPSLAKPAPWPAPRHHFDMVYDTARSRLVVFGGNVETGSGLGWTDDTWEWDGARWELRAASGPAGVSSHALAYDRDRGVTLLFGGARADRTLSDEAWLWSGQGWRRADGAPSARHSPAMGYDERRRRMVLYGGSGRGDDVMWELDGDRWLPVALDDPHPPPLMRAGLVFCPNLGAMLLFGGYLDGVHGVTWAWNGRRWSRLEVEGPPARANHAMAVDRDRGRVVLFGGSNADRALFADTWEWDGRRWTKVADTGPAPRTVAGMAYDARVRRIVLYGGRSASRQPYGDMWSWDGAAWREVGSDG